ncbi:MAG: protein kinase [Planctomycetes bacterium]|nr:protein kinase [Planctomycetota bacterium]
MSSEPSHDPARPAPPCGAAVEAFCQYLRLLELGQEVDWAAWRKSAGVPPEELDRLREEYERISAILEALAPAASFSARLRARYGDELDPGISLSGDAPRRGGSSSGAASGSGSGVLERLGTQGREGGRYEPRREIARGGMGAILEVWDTELRRTLAMKVVLTDRADDGSDDSEGRTERRLSRFLEEAQITGQLDHPGIVPVHDIGIDARGRIFFTMQLVDGLDLRKVFELARLERDGWTARRVIGVLIRVCEAMAYAHSKGVVHRDLKPANIMVGRFGEAFVMDWGLAKVMGSESAAPRKSGLRDALEGARVVTDRSDSDSDGDAALRTLDGDVVGTPAYMAPEQARGDLGAVGPCSDVYAVGAMLYHLLSGHMPYEPLGEKVAAHTILEAVRRGPPWPLRQLNPEVDEELAAICAKAMEREPEQRYGDVMDLGEELRAWLEGRGVRAYTTGVLYETRKWMARNRATTAALFALIGFALASVLLFMWQQQANFDKLRREKDRSDLAVKARELAQEDLNAKVAELRENEQQLRLEAARAERERQNAQAEEERAKLATQRANDSAERARQSEQAALAGAYRSHVNAAAYSLRLAEVDQARAHLEECSPASRGWEWRHLRLATEQSVGTPLVQERPVTTLEASADGRLLVSYGLGLPARVWKADDLSLVSELEAVASMTAFNFSRYASAVCAAFHPAGEMLVLSDPTTSFAQLYNVQRAGPVLSYRTSDAAAQAIVGLAVTPEGDRVVTASRQGVGRVHALWGGEELTRFGFASGAGAGDAGWAERTLATCLALSPDGRLAAMGASDGSVGLFELETGATRLRLAGAHLGGITAIALTEDGGRLVSASEDGSLGVWDARSGALVAMMHGHTGAVNDVALVDREGLVVSAGEDMTVRVWELTSGRQRSVLHGHDAAVHAVVTLADGRRVATASADGSIRVWDLGWNAATTLCASTDSFLAGDFDADGRHVYATTLSGRARRVDLDVDRSEELHLAPGAALPKGALVLSCEASPDGELLALGLGDRSLRVVRAADGVEVLRRVDLERSPLFLRFSEDGARLLVAGQGREAWVVEVDGARWTRLGDDSRRGGVQRPLRGADLSPDGRLVATIDSDGDLRLWDAATGGFERALRNPHGAALTAVAFDPTSTRVATAGKDQSVRLWDAETLEALHVLRGHRTAPQALAFHPDGTRLASGGSNGEVRLWSLESGESLLELVGLRGAALDLEFDGFGERLVGVGPESGIVVWESARAEERYAHRAQEYRRFDLASAHVCDLLREFYSPELVQTALRDDGALGEEERERSLAALEHARGDLRLCEELCSGWLLGARGSGRRSEALAVWLSELGERWGSDPRWLWLSAALALRQERPADAAALLARRRELVPPGARELLLEGLAASRTGGAQRAAELLEESRRALEAETPARRGGLSGLLEELERGEGAGG